MIIANLALCSSLASQRTLVELLFIKIDWFINNSIGWATSQLALAPNCEPIRLDSPGLTGLVLGGVDVGEGPRELFIACDDILAELLATGGLPLY